MHTKRGYESMFGYYEKVESSRFVVKETAALENYTYSGMRGSPRQIIWRGGLLISLHKY